MDNLIGSSSIRRAMDDGVDDVATMTPPYHFHPNEAYEPTAYHHRQYDNQLDPPPSYPEEDQGDGEEEEELDDGDSDDEGEYLIADDLLEPPPVKPAPSKGITKGKKQKKEKKKKKKHLPSRHTTTTKEIFELLSRLGPDVDLSELTSGLAITPPSPVEEGLGNKKLKSKKNKQPKTTPKKTNTSKSIKKQKKKKENKKKNKRLKEKHLSPLYYAPDSSLISERTIDSTGATIATLTSSVLDQQSSSGAGSTSATTAPRMTTQFTGTTMESTTYHSGSMYDDEDSALGLGSSGILSYRSDRSTTPASLRLSTPTNSRTLTPTEILEGAIFRGAGGGSEYDSGASVSPSVGSNNFFIASEDEQSATQLHQVMRTAEQDWHRYSGDMVQHTKQAMQLNENDGDDEDFPSPPDGSVSVSASASSFSVGGASSFSVGAALHRVRVRGTVASSSEGGDFHSEATTSIDDNGTYSSSSRRHHRTMRRSRPPPPTQIQTMKRIRQNSIRGQESIESMTTTSSSMRHGNYIEDEDDEGTTSDLMTRGSSTDNHHRRKPVSSSRSPPRTIIGRRTRPSAPPSSSRKTTTTTTTSSAPRPAPSSPSSDDDSDSELRALHSRFASRRLGQPPSRRVRRPRRSTSLSSSSSSSHPSSSKPMDRKAASRAAAAMPGSLRSLSSWVEESTRKGRKPDSIVRQLVNQGGMDESTASGLVAKHLANNKNVDAGGAATAADSVPVRMGSIEVETSEAAMSTTAAGGEEEGGEGGNTAYSSIASQLRRLKSPGGWLGESSRSGARPVRRTASAARSDEESLQVNHPSDESESVKVVDSTPRRRSTSAVPRFLRKDSPFRRLVLTGILVVIVAVTIGVSLGVLVPGDDPPTSGEDGNRPSASPTFAPTAMPTFISDDVRQAAAAISGMEVVSTPGTPHYDAVGWLSTRDEEGVVRGINDDDAELFTQRYVLVLLYFSTNGREWGPEWLDPQAHECDWDFEYVKCVDVDGGTRRVVDRLVLVDVGLQGTMPTELGMLKSIVRFSMALNPQLTGSIPNELCGKDDDSGGLERLSWLDLKGNGLTGSIPSNIGRCMRLRDIFLGQNQLNGTIPGSLFDLSSLEQLELSNNHLQGPIAPTADGLSQFSSLGALNLARNNLTGTIPDLSAATRLKNVFLDWNLLTGPVPTFGTQLAGLKIFSSSHNQLTGSLESLASPFGGEIKEFDIGFNKLTGEFPSLVGLTALPSLTYLDLSGNDFTGTIDTTGGHLESFLCADNRLNGTLDGIDSGKLRIIDLRSNDFVGGIPQTFYSFSHLETLMMSNNPKIHGMLDDDLGDLTGLRHIQLRNCGLSGTIPSTLGDIDSCITFDISGNDIEGTIPTEVGMWTSLRNLHLQSNKLESTLPTELVLLTDLTILNVANNELTGSLPQEINWLGNLEELYTSGNDITGNISAALCNQATNLSFENLGCGFSCPCCTDTMFCDASRE